MSHRAAASVLAGFVLIVGLALGFWQHSIPFTTSRNPADATINCGSPFGPTHLGKAADAGSYLGSVYSGEPNFTDYETQCSDTLEGTRILAIILTTVGGLIGLYLISTKKVEKNPRSNEDNAAAADDVTA